MHKVPGLTLARIGHGAMEMATNLDGIYIKWPYTWKLNT